MRYKTNYYPNSWVQQVGSGEFKKLGTEMVTDIEIPYPVDLHQHFRDGWLMRGITVPQVTRRFRAALAMPNLTPPVVTWRDINTYHDRLRAALPDAELERFEFLMTLYMTSKLCTETVLRCINTKNFWFAGIKYYPRGLTTNSDSGLENPAEMWTPHTEAWRVLRTLATYGKTLFVHAADGVDAQGGEIDPYEQERHFIQYSLPSLRRAHPELKISLEHLSTAEATMLFLKKPFSNQPWKVIEKYDAGYDPYLGASLTPHHLLLDRRDMLRGGFHPGRFWLPLLQSGKDRDMLRTLAASGHPRVWLGSDSAPHPTSAKLADCCKGGVLTAHAGIELYVEAFEQADALGNFQAFACTNGPNFIGYTPLTRPDKLHLRREPWTVSRYLSYGGVDLEQDAEVLTPFRAGETIEWKIVDAEEESNAPPSPTSNV